MDQPPSYEEATAVRQCNTEPILNEEQQRVMKDIIQGRHVLITGAAGTGKSFLVDHMSKTLDSLKRVFAILAPTGIAAENIGGFTIHRFLCLRPEICTIQDYERLCMKRSRVPWNSISVLIIDEVSMLHPKLFVLFDQIARLHKRNSSPFGGIQLILLGDFHQLSPIKDIQDKIGDPEYIFEADCYQNLRIRVHVLNKVMRQTDVDFIEALNDLRVGNYSKKVSTMIEYCSKNTREPGKHYVKLFPKNVDKNFANETALAKIETPSKVFRAKDSGDEKELKNCRWEKEITLKINCPVMLLWNLPEQGLCNGSIGIVDSFDQLGHPVVRFNSGITMSVPPRVWNKYKRTSTGRILIATRTQVPLAIAFSLTVHKAQGLSLDHVEANCKGIFTTGHLYVMLSRCTSKEGLIINDFRKEDIMVDQKIIEYYDRLKGN